VENPSRPSPISGSGAQFVRVLAPKIAQGVFCRFLGPYRGLITHYVRKRSLVCPGASLCPPADHKLRSVWRGYAAVEEWIPAAKVWRAALLEVTESAEEFLRGRSLRGEIWLFERTGQSQEKSAVKAVFCEMVDPQTLRDPFNVDNVLKRFYRVASLPPDGPNPLPSRIVVPDSPGDAPQLPGKIIPAFVPSAAEEIVKRVVDREKHERERAEWREKYRDVHRNGSSK
jgi:hypothetical protein